jgi:peptide deformylase
MDTPSPIGPRDPRLLEPAAEVDPTSPETLATARILLNYMQTQDIRGVGMAATQFGIAQDVFVANVNAGKKDENGDALPAHWVAFFNIRTVWMSQETDQYSEACYSVCTDGGELHDLRVNVTRPVQIRISGWSLDLMDSQAQPVELIDELVEGFLARIVLHESDHNDNRTILSYVTNPADVHHVPAARLDEHRESADSWPPAPKPLWLPLLDFTRPLQ